jgi:hypothetical protein
MIFLGFMQEKVDGSWLDEFLEVTVGDDLTQWVPSSEGNRVNLSGCVNSRKPHKLTL